MECKLITVARKDKGTEYAIVDAVDFEFLNKWRWFLSDKGYAKRSVTMGGKEHTIWMHRVVAGIPDDSEMQGDHINGNRLDNRGVNLRIVDLKGNARNRFVQQGKLGGVKYKGVYANRLASTFNARIRVAKDKILYLGSFRCQEEAARAYDAAALEHFGEHAKLNFPDLAPYVRPGHKT